MSIIGMASVDNGYMLKIGSLRYMPSVIWTYVTDDLYLHILDQLCIVHVILHNGYDYLLAFPNIY